MKTSCSESSHIAQKKDGWLRCRKCKLNLFPDLQESSQSPRVDRPMTPDFTQFKFNTDVKGLGINRNFKGTATIKSGKSDAALTLIGMLQEIVTFHDLVGTSSIKATISKVLKQRITPNI